MSMISLCLSSKASCATRLSLLHNQTSCFVRARLLRVRLCTSPATGLTGLQENQFLGDFFKSLGFLALADQR